MHGSFDKRKLKETVTLRPLCFTISDSDVLPFPSILSLEAWKMLSRLFLRLNGQDDCSQSQLVLQMNEALKDLAHDLLLIIETDR